MGWGYRVNVVGLGGGGRGGGQRNKKFTVLMVRFTCIVTLMLASLKLQAPGISTVSHRAMILIVSHRAISHISS